MRKGLLIAFSVLLLVACKSKNKIPRDIIPRQKMQTILWDMMRADQFLADYVLNRDTSLKKETESLKYYKQIFTIHKISREEFQRSFSFYRSHPDLLKSIMDSISAPVNQAPTALAQPAQQLPAIVADTTVKPPVSVKYDTTRRRERKKMILVE